ncbi:MAG: NAD(P)/FAD-dependent oxidoreductase [Pseudomonadota bacterium]
MPSDVSVVIIGAGAAGLSAAKTLSDREIDFVLLEGSHRIGGRAYSEEIAPGVWFDLGCSYLHGRAPNPFESIADSLGVTIGKKHGDMFDHVRAYRNGTQLQGEALDAYREYDSACDRAIEAAFERNNDIAIADVIDLDSPFAVSYIEGMAALNTLDVDQTSTVDFWQANTGQDIPVLNGYGNLVSKWGHDVPVSLNTRVERIEWSKSPIIVHTSKGTLRAKTVLNTVSNGVLAAADIEFSPRLPHWKTDAIHALPTGTENKICLHFDCDIFGDEGRGFHNVWNDDGDAAGFEASVMGLNTAVVFTGGRHAIWLEKQGQAAGHDYALDRVAEVFGNDIRKHVTRSIVTAWATEPWTKGAYSCALPGQAHQRLELAKPIDEVLFFAGEATITFDNSTCHGALKSGIRAAEEVCKSVQNNR